MNMTKEEAIFEAGSLITYEWDDEGLCDNGTIVDAHEKDGKWHFLVARAGNKAEGLEEYVLADGWYRCLGTAGDSDRNILARIHAINAGEVVPMRA